MLQRFTFSQVFGPETTQEEFFEGTMKQPVQDFLDGYNRLVLKHGVTNAGKTYTFQGTEDNVGILPRTMDMLFKSIQGRLYTAMDLKPHRCRDYIKLTENQVREETAIKNSLLRLIKEMLVNLLEVLRNKLITEKQNNLLLEMKIREEVIQEFTHYFAQREVDFKESLSQERAHLEENSEQRLEIFKEHASSYTKNADERSKSQDGPCSDQAGSLMATSQSVRKEYPLRRQDSTRNKKSAKKKQGTLQKIGDFFQSSSTVIHSKAKKLIETISSSKSAEPENVEENELRPKRAKRRLYTTDISCLLDIPGSSILVEPKEKESDHLIIKRRL